MAYTSTRLVRRFSLLSPKKVINGSPASSGLFTQIADNQQYLFGSDMPMTTFFSGRGISNKNSIIASGTTVKTVYGRVLMPPFATHCEFWFNCDTDASSDDDSTPGYPYITIASDGTGGESRGFTGLPVSSDTDTAGESAFAQAPDDLGMYGARWVGLFGEGATAVSTSDVQAVKMLTAVAVWTEVTFTMTWRASSTAAGQLFMNAAYYRVVAPKYFAV